MSLIHYAWSFARRRALLALSAVAIALGVAVLFTVLAVLNGFLAQFEGTMRDFSGDLTVRPLPSAWGGSQEIETYFDSIHSVQGVATVEARLNWFGLVGRRGSRALSDPRSSDLNGLLLVGIDDFDWKPQDDPNALPPLRLGHAAATRMGVSPGDTLEVISFQPRPGRAPIPARLSFSVVESFSSGQHDQDLDRALVPRSSLLPLTQLKTPFTELVIRVNDGIDPESLQTIIQEQLEQDGLARPSWPSVQTWRDNAGNFLRAVENQRGMLVMMFFFIVLVAAYQLVATLTLTVTEKRRDIGVLGALGATPGRIIRFWVSLGTLVSFFGVSLGLGLGYLLTSNLKSIELILGGGEKIFLPEIYQFEEIPVLIDTYSVALLAGATLAAGLVFSLIPAWRAARRPILQAMIRR